MSIVYPSKWYSYSYEYTHSGRKSTTRRTRTVRRGRVGNRRPDFLLPQAKAIQRSRRRGTLSRVQNFTFVSQQETHALSASSVRCEDIAPTLAEMLR
eukprot:scaffold167965_cov20-Prasinocladus_malaysianus.AAC.1